MKKILLGLLSLATAIGMFSVGVTQAGANDSPFFSVKASVFDPTSTGQITAKWVLEPAASGQPATTAACKKDGWKSFTNPSFKNQGQCIKFVKKHKKNGNFVLLLSKNVSTQTNAAATASLTGINSLTLNQLGFDFQGYCGA